MGYLEDYQRYLVNKKNLPSVIEEGDIFRVLQYKIVMRKEVNIENKEHPSEEYQAICHADIYQNIRAWLDNPTSKPYDYEFFPLYIMHHSWGSIDIPTERSIFYGGMTNSNSSRFSNHAKLNEFIDNKRSRKDRKLHMCQLLVTYLHEDTVYENTPLEWIFFSEDEGKKPRYTIINKMITFVETVALISPKTERNSLYCIPNVNKGIYTENLKTIVGIDGCEPKTFYANSSHQPIDIGEEDVMFHIENVDVELLGVEKNGEVIEGETEEEINRNYQVYAGAQKKKTGPYNNDDIYPKESTILKKMDPDKGEKREYWTEKIYVDKQLDYENYMNSLESMENNNE